jgi:carotenoid cleavage dioxygenase
MLSCATQLKRNIHYYNIKSSSDSSVVHHEMADIDSVEPLLAVPANVDFPPRPIYSGAEAPCRFEAEIYNCETRGQIPAAVNGTYYRTMPDQEWAPEFNDDVFFNGDGVVDAFRFKNGVVDFKQKFCRTRKFVIERAARKSLFGKFFNMYVADPRVKDEIRGTSNTHIIYYNQMLLAMSENSLPFAMDPDTLDTIGSSSLT